LLNKLNRNTLLNVAIRQNMKKFIAVIVLYNQSLEMSETFISLSKAMARIEDVLELVVYDNSRQPCNIEKLSGNKFVINYIHDPNNPGVSSAYNCAANIGRTSGKDWLLMFDQDTILPDDILLKYLDAIIAYPDEKLFSPLMITTDNKVVSPCKFRFNKGFSTTDTTFGRRSLNGYSLINCGLCIRIETFYEINGYDPQFKLDYSDHDFITRYKKGISNFVVVINSKVSHMLSAKQHNSLESDKQRFFYFRDALIRYSMIHGGKLFSMTNIYLRIFKLSLIHRSGIFLKYIFF
jgi:rhamnosyltransferase